MNNQILSMLGDMIHLIPTVHPTRNFTTQYVLKLISASKVMSIIEMYISTPTRDCTTTTNTNLKRKTKKCLSLKVKVKC